MVWIKPNDVCVVPTNLLFESGLAIFLAPLGEVDMVCRNIANRPKLFSVINIDWIKLANRLNDVALVKFVDRAGFRFQNNEISALFCFAFGNFARKSSPRLQYDGVGKRNVATQKQQD